MGVPMTPAQVPAAPEMSLHLPGFEERRSNASGHMMITRGFRAASHNRPLDGAVNAAPYKG